MNTIMYVVVVSPGYNGAPAINFNTTKEGVICCSFKAAEKVKDGYNNWNFEAYGEVADKVSRLKVDAGSNVTISGTLSQKPYTAAGVRKINIVCSMWDINYTNTYNPKKTNYSERDDGANVESTTAPQSPTGINQEAVTINKPVNLSEIARNREQEQHHEKNVTQPYGEIKQVNLDQDEIYITQPDEGFFN